MSILLGLTQNTANTIPADSLTGAFYGGAMCGQGTEAEDMLPFLPA